jgi:hypothetical protein
LCHPLRVFHFLEQDARSPALMPECFRGAEDVALDDVIAEDDTNILAVGEVLAQAQSIGDSAFAFLVSIGDVLKAEMLAVGQQAEKIALNSFHRSRS